MHVFLNFDFYGAGNVGDDLMLAGFLEAFAAEKMSCYTLYSYASQKQRFPHVTWLKRSNQVDLSGVDVMVGVGDTPFQIKGGEWFLNKLANDTVRAQARGIPIYLFGVGAESEIVSRREAFSRVAEKIDFIWTRDSFSRDVIVDTLAYDPAKIKVISDLANISLERLFPATNKASPRLVDRAVCYFDETPRATNSAAIKQLLMGHTPSLFVANETRREKPFEPWLYRNMFSLRERTFGAAKQVPLFVPDYGRGTVAQLVKHYATYKTVITSRYHSLLTAAWAGCKVVALERSSKVEALAEALGVPLVASPFSLAALEAGVERAKRVERRVLTNLSAAARAGVAELETFMGQLEQG